MSGIGLSSSRIKLIDDAANSNVADDIALIVNSAHRILQDLMQNLDGHQGDIVWGVCSLLELANSMASELQGRLAKEDAE